MPFVTQGWNELADGVFRRKYDELYLNVGVILGDDGVFLVDTRMSVSQGKQLRNEIRELTSLPVKYVLNTHFHYDHTFGNECFPEAELWGHRRCREELLERGEYHRMRAVRRVQQLVEEGLYHQTEGWDTSEDPWDALMDVQITAPSNTLVTSTEFDLGRNTLKVHYLGRGHTDSDVVLVVEGPGVAFAGDLLEEVAPPVFIDSFPLEWPSTIDALQHLGPTTVVPGHGDVMDPERVAIQHDELILLADLIRGCHAGDLAIDDAIAEAPYPASVVAPAFERGLEQLHGGRVGLGES